MIRFFLILILLLVGLAGLAWYSSQSLPAWYQAEQDQQQQVVDDLSEKIQEQGIGKFLGSKFAGVMNGQLELSETEFNGLMIASLRAHHDGQRLLQVSDAVKIELRDNELELGVVLDLDKVAKLDAKSKKAVQQLKDALPFLDNSKVFLSITGQPIARDGNISFGDEYDVKIGALPVSSKLLARLGVPVAKASSASLPLKYLTVSSIDMQQDKIILGVYPRL